jgi:hypothetical protein
MKADERKHLEENSLAHGVETLVDRVRSGRLWNIRVIGIILAVVVVGGVWWYAARESRRANSLVWTDLVEIERKGGPDDLAKFADSNKDLVAGQLARLELARQLFGPDGVALLRGRDREQQNKGLENIEKARGEFTALADAFKDNATLQATCLTSAAEAELALVGVPKAGGSPESKGSVKTAAELYRKAATVLGESTPAGEKARKRADELETNAATIEKVGKDIYDTIFPTTGFTVPPPGGNANGPKAPTGSIETPKPPTGTPPKAPTKPLTPPAVTPKATPPKTTVPTKPAPPKTTVPTKK